ncbi:MAG: hypothetical protein AAF408_01180, partial [Pseudomonadota bacterium]
DKCVSFFDCDADDAAMCDVPGIGKPAKKIVELDDKNIGNTTINTTEADMAKYYLDEDAYVDYNMGTIHFDILGLV